MAIKITTVDEFLAQELPEIPSILGDRLLVPEGRMIIYGQPGTFKSFATLQLCYAMALGYDYLSYTVHAPQRVLYLQAEIVPTMAQERMQKMKDFYGEAPNFSYGYTRDFSLRTSEDWNDLRDAILEANAQFVFIDPMSQIFAGSELDDEKTRLFFQDLDVLSTVTSCGIGLVHHARKTTWNNDGSTNESGAGDLRGHSSIEAWADSIVRIRQTREAGDALELMWQKVRHAPVPMSKYLRFDEECGMLTLTDKDPYMAVMRWLEEGSMGVTEIDKRLKEGLGIHPVKAARIRKSLEKDKKIEQMNDPLNGRFRIARLTGAGRSEL
jgi:hypothetical protein